MGDVPNDVGVIEMREHLRFAHEPLVLGELSEQLERDDGPRRAVPRAIHRGHAARPGPRLDDEAFGDDVTNLHETTIP
jgi:hypothetical protein